MVQPIFDPSSWSVLLSVNLAPALCRDPMLALRWGAPAPAGSAPRSAWAITAFPLSERPAGMAARWRGHRLQGFDILAVFPDRLN